jgi:hypothetical protein
MGKSMRPVFLRAPASRAYGASSVLRSKTLASPEFTSGDVSEIRGPRAMEHCVGENWRDNPAAIQNFGYTED